MGFLFLRRVFWFGHGLRAASLCAVLGSALTGFVLANEQTDPRQERCPPNILLIVADDLNTALGCYGHPVVKTPHIDRLASRGVRFERAYSQATICSPSRASIFSGLRPHTTGVLDNETSWPDPLPDLTYLPAYFQNLGYFTATFGKVLDHKRVPEQPYWNMEVPEWGKYPRADRILEQAPFYPGSTGSMFWAKLKGSDAGTPDGEMARRAVRLLEQRTGSEVPLLAAVGFRRPHTPYAVPEKYFDLYPPQRLSLPVARADDVARIPPGAEDVKPFRGNRDDALRALGAYYACVSYVDAQVGVLLAALDALEMWDDTVVVFVSDHGYHTGHLGRWHKGWLFEQTARVPLIVAAPGKRSGACARIVELLDLFPTLVELCGENPPSALEGRSFACLLDACLLDDRHHPWDKMALTTIGCLDADDRRTYVGHSVRTEDWRYTEWDGGKRGVELYRFSDDPKGVRNIARDPHHADTMGDLRQRLNLMVDASGPARQSAIR